MIIILLCFVQASHDRGLGGGGSSNSKPVFGKPIEKKDSELHKITLVCVQIIITHFACVRCVDDLYQFSCRLRMHNIHYFS